ncbi:MAG: histidine kinase [Spirosomataceae bacterium]
MDFRNDNWLNRYRIPLLHLIVWTVLFLLPYIYASHERAEGEHDSELEDNFVLLNTILKVFWVLLFYLNTQLLIPKWLYQKQYFLFIVFQFSVFGGILFVDHFLFDWLNISRPFRLENAIKHNISPFLFTCLTSIAFKSVWDKIQADYAANERQKETLRTELSFLRSQISPHFLFNVLNNIVAMVRLQSTELEATVVKLSTLLQYMLYETDEEKVLLLNEVEYLESYIDLQSQRFGTKIQIFKDIHLQENWHPIEPMLLIPFVENAFKHGYGLVENPVIDIKLTAHDNQLFFEVSNKFVADNGTKDKVSGIGLFNVRRRLELLYPNRHQLHIVQEDGWFKVSLQLTLKP